MQLKYRLYRRSNGGFYWQENDGPKQGSLRTKNKHEAERLLNAKSDALRQPTLNLALGRAYLSARDPNMVSRTWQAVMNEMATPGIETTRERCTSHKKFACGASEISQPNVGSDFVNFP